MTHMLSDIEKTLMKTQVPEVEVGDTVEVHVRITEGKSSRIQKFIGAVIRLRGGGVGRTVTVRRIVQGEGVERIFPLHSPIVENIVVLRKGVVRRAKLYYLRDRVGKATRIRERIVRKDDSEKKKRERKRGKKAKAARKARREAADAQKNSAPQPADAAAPQADARAPSPAPQAPTPEPAPAVASAGSGDADAQA